MNNTYLGVDQSLTSTGWCILDNEKNIIDCGVIRSEKADDTFERVNTVKDQLLQVINNHDPEYIAIEGLGFSSIGNQTRNLAGLQFVIVCCIREMGRSIEVIAPTTIKKHAHQILLIDDPELKSKMMTKKQNMYKALPQKTKDELDPYNFLKTKGLYDVTDAWWLSAAIVDKHNK